MLLNGGQGLAARARERDRRSRRLCQPEDKCRPLTRQAKPEELPGGKTDGSSCLDLASIASREMNR